MSDSKVIEKIRGSQFFQAMPDEDLAKLAGIAREVELPPNTTMFEQYESGSDVYILLEGQVGLVICEPRDMCRQIAVVGEGDLIGWSPLIGRTRLTDTAVTRTPVKALVFKAEELLDFCTENPSSGFEFMRQAASALAIRLSGTRLQLLQMCGTQFPEFDYQFESD
jgi:CRP-like cAMP-binding protein